MHSPRYRKVSSSGLTAEKLDIIGLLFESNEYLKDIHYLVLNNVSVNRSINVSLYCIEGDAVT